LRDLEFLNVAGDQRMKVTPLGPMQFGGPKSRSLVVPAAVLPSVEDEQP